MLRPPKVPGWLNKKEKKKKKKKKKNNNPLEINRALRLTGLGPNKTPVGGSWAHCMHDSFEPVLVIQKHTALPV